jgi:hypothetical protein
MRAQIGACNVCKVPFAEQECCCSHTTTSDHAANTETHIDAYCSECCPLRNAHKQWRLEHPDYYADSLLDKAMSDD